MNSTAIRMVTASMKTGSLTIRSRSVRMSSVPTRTNRRGDESAVLRSGDRRSASLYLRISVSRPLAWLARASPAMTPHARSPAREKERQQRQVRSKNRRSGDRTSGDRAIAIADHPIADHPIQLPKALHNLIERFLPRSDFLERKRGEWFIDQIQ